MIYEQISPLQGEVLILFYLHYTFWKAACREVGGPNSWSGYQLTAPLACRLAGVIGSSHHQQWKTDPALDIARHPIEGDSNLSLLNYRQRPSRFLHSQQSWYNIKSVRDRTRMSTCSLINSYTKYCFRACYDSILCQQIMRGGGCHRMDPGPTCHHFISFGGILVWNNEEACHLLVCSGNWLELTTLF